MREAPLRPAAPRARSRASAVLALTLCVPLATLGAAAALWWWPGTVVGIGLYWLGKLVIALFPALWWRFAEGRPWSHSPARRGGFGMALTAGALIAAAVAAVAALALRSGWIDLARLHAVAAENHLDNPAVYAVLTLILSFFNALLEEYFWRWFVIREARHLLPATGAVLGAAALFTVHHAVALRAYFPWPMVALGCVGVFIGGVLWGWMLGRYRSIWPGFVCHMLADLALMGAGYWLIFVVR